jgi:hypothetical protein
MDALDGIRVGVRGDEDDRYVAYLSEPPSRLDPFATSFEINVHQNNIGLILHCLQKGILSVCGQIASVEAQLACRRLGPMPRENAFFMKPLVRELAAALMKK